MSSPTSRRPWPALAVLALAVATIRPLPAQDAKADPAATRDYAVAVGLQNRGLYGQAAARWQKFLKEHPGDPRLPNATNHLGTCQLQEKKYADAAVTFRGLLAKFPKFEARDAAQYNLGLALYNLGLGSKKDDDLKEAARAFAEVTAKHPASKHAAAALYYQGESLYQAGDLQGAEAAYRKLIADHPKSDLLPDALYALGTARQELGQEKEAAAAFEELLTKFPKDRLAAESRLRVAQSLFKQKRYAEAEQAFAQAAALPDFPFADFALIQQAECLYARDQFPQAAVLYEQLPKRFPRSKYAAAALLSAGKCWYRAGKLNGAQAALAKAAEEKSAEAPEAAYWLAQTLLALKRPADAVAALDRAAGAHPQSPLVPKLQFTKLTALYEQPEQRKLVAPLFAVFARNHAGHELAPRALYMAALAALRLDDHAAARQYAESFLQDKQYGKHDLLPDVLFLAAESYLNAPQPDPARAEPLYRRISEEYPKHAQAPAAQLRVGTCLYLARKHGEAAPLLAQAAAGLTDDALRAEAYHLLGRAYADLGKTAEADAAFRKALEVKTGSPHADEARLALASSLRAQKKPAEAADLLRKLAQESPKSPHRPRALYLLGELAAEQGKHDEALTWYTQVTAQHPKSELGPLAQLGAGTTMFAKKDYAKAVESLSALVAGPAPPEVALRARYVRGLAHQRLKQHAQAAADLTAFLAGKPKADAADARLALALAQSGQGQHQQAADTLAALLKEEPDYAQADQARYEMAFALLQAKKGKEAAQAFRELAAKHPDSPLAGEAWFRIGAALEEAGQGDEACKAYAAGLEKVKTPDLREKLRYKLGWCHYQAKRFAEAADALQAQLKESPRGELAADAAYLAGECLFRESRAKEALPLFDRVIAAGAKKYLPRALYRSGACLADLRDWPASQKRYAALVEQFPQFEMVHEGRYGLAWALQNQDRLREAVEVYTQITKATNSETAAKSRFMIGEVAFKEKKYKEAIEHFLETALGYPYKEWQALSYFEAGRCFIELNDTKRAAETLGTLLKQFPDHPRAKDAARLLADLKK